MVADSSSSLHRYRSAGQVASWPQHRSTPRKVSSRPAACPPCRLFGLVNCSLGAEGQTLLKRQTERSPTCEERLGFVFRGAPVGGVSAKILRGAARIQDLAEKQQQSLRRSILHGQEYFLPAQKY